MKKSLFVISERKEKREKKTNYSPLSSTPLKSSYENIYIYIGGGVARGGEGDKNIDFN